MASQFGKKTSENIEIINIPISSRSSCTDLKCDGPNGYDWDDGLWTCDEYNNYRCEQYGDYVGSGGGTNCGTGLTANEACCVCGGGAISSPFYSEISMKVSTISDDYDLYDDCFESVKFELSHDTDFNNFHNNPGLILPSQYINVPALQHQLKVLPFGTLIY